MTDTNREILDVLKGGETPTFGGQPGTPVPEVDPADIKIVYSADCELQARHPGQTVAIGREVFKHICSPGANLPAVSCRTATIQLLEMILLDLLSEWRKGSQMDERVFLAAASIPLEWQKVGVVRHGLPFDVEAFMRRVREQGQSAAPEA
jgi:hypothetical protein